MRLLPKNTTSFVTFIYHLVFVSKLKESQIMWPGNIEICQQCMSLFMNGLSAVGWIKKNNIKIIFQ